MIAPLMCFVPLDAPAPHGYTLIDGSMIAECETTFPHLWHGTPERWRNGTDLHLPDATWQGLRVALQHTEDDNK